MTLLDQQQHIYQDKCQHFGVTVKEKLRDSNHVILLNNDEQPHDWEDLDFSKDEDFIRGFGKKLAVDDHTIPEADNLPNPTPDSFDPYINMELSLPRRNDNTMEFSRVFKRKKDMDGNLICIANDNPILDSRIYIVEWLDERKED